MATANDDGFVSRNIAVLTFLCVLSFVGYGLEASRSYSRESATTAAAMPQFKCGQGNKKINDQCSDETSTVSYACQYPDTKKGEPKRGALCIRGLRCAGIVGGF